MNIIGNLLGHVLRIIYDVVQNYGWSIIVFTILVKVLLLPLTIKQTKSTKAMQDIQPKLQEIQEKYKNKPEKQQQEIMPIIIGLFSVLRDPVAYGVFQNEAAFKLADTGFLWLQSLTATHNIEMGILSGVSAYVMQKVMTPPDQA